MAEWIEFTTIDLGYYDPRNGRTLTSIEGLKNRPKIDPFKHKGIVYPEVYNKYNKPSCLEGHEKGRKLLIKLDITKQEADDLIVRELRLKPRKLTEQEVMDAYEFVPR